MHGSRSNGKGASKEGGTEGITGCTDMNSCSCYLPSAHSAVAVAIAEVGQAKEAEVKVEPAPRGSVALYV